ncbi:hypothetical protein RB597_001652 [Gaeumannomyces tritici]
MAAMPGNPILVTRSTPCPGVVVLTLNRPEKRNALSQALINNLLRELTLASNDPSVKAVVLSGGPAFFCAGADIKEISEIDAEGARKHRYLEDLCNGMSSFRKPIFAAVEAMALGGGFEICLMSDLIFASKGCKFGLPEVKIGLIPGAGGTQRLTNAVGKYQAMKMILFGTIIDVEEASSHGLIAGTFPPGAVLDGAIKVAQQVAGLSSTAVQLAKEAICRISVATTSSKGACTTSRLGQLINVKASRPSSKNGSLTGRAQIEERSRRPSRSACVGCWL